MYNKRTRRGCRLDAIRAKPPEIVDIWVQGPLFLPPSIIHTYLIPWSKVLLEKLTGSQLVKKLPAFYGTQRFITAFTTARHPSPS